MPLAQPTEKEAAFLAEFERRTGTKFTDCGFDDSDMDRWLNSEDDVNNAVYAMIDKYGLIDLDS